MIIQPHNLKIAIDALKLGEVVAIPTETVYGLAADITQEKAVKNIFQLKGRPSNHPLIIHISDVSALYDYAVEIQDYVFVLAKAFWPGPLSMVLKKSERVSDFVTGGQNTVAIRMPNHPLALSLIQQVGHPLAAPSANRFGKISPTQANHVVEEFGCSVKIVEGEICSVGIESTIIDATHPNYITILRPGMISSLAIQEVVGSRYEVIETPHAMQVSGNLKSHYAPTKPTFLFESKKELEAIIKHYTAVDVLSISEEYANFGMPMPKEPMHYANLLYKMLRQADNSEKKAIAIEMPENTKDWNAIKDRLKKCSANYENPR